MFTTPPNTPVGGFLEGLANRDIGSLLRAAWLNYVSNQLPNALDAIGGGYYQFVGDIKLSSDTKQIKINAPVIGHPTNLLGYTTIGLSDDVNYATGTGTLTVSIPATFTAGVTMSGALIFSNTVQFNGAVTVNAATTFTNSGDITLQSGCDLIGQSGSALFMQSGSTSTLAGATTLSNVSTLTLASGASFSLATNVSIATAARTYSRTIDHPPIYDSANWGNYYDAESILPIYSSQTVAGGASEIVWAWRPPSGATVTAASVFLKPAGAHVGVPNVEIAVAKLVRTSNGAVNSASQVDTSANVVDYETPHELAVSGFSLTFSEGDLLLVRVSPETGGNALVSLKVSPPIITFSRTKIGEE